MNGVTVWISGGLRAALQKLFGRLIRRRMPFLQLAMNSEGLRIRAIGSEQALEYHQPGEYSEFCSLLPTELIQQFSGKHDQAVQLSHSAQGNLIAQWQEKGVPYSQEYILPSNEEKAPPALPKRWSENPPEILPALREAFTTTDEMAVRYAFGCIQIHGQRGEIGATDGRQGLLQSGFAFPFTDELLVRRTEVFGCEALHSAKSVEVGCADDRLVLRSGPWTVWLAIEKEGRFPRLRDSIPAVSTASSTIELTESDLKFLAENLDRLPSTADDRAITLDVNGTVTVRSAPAGTSVPTELILKRSSTSGEDLRIRFDRRYLERVAKMNLKFIHLYGSDQVVRASDERRSFVWMPYSVDRIVMPHAEAERFESTSEMAPRQRRGKVVRVDRRKDEEATSQEREAAAALRGELSTALRKAEEIVRRLSPEENSENPTTAVSSTQGRAA